MFETVNFISDGLRLTPPEYVDVLRRCTQAGGVANDAYALGGTVTAVEAKFAQLLGKERAIFMPTGTMANHIALRELAGAQRRVIVQAESHVYKDIGDGPQTLSGLNLIPLAPERVTFTLEQVQEVLQLHDSERVATGVGVISIESMVRRLDDAMFDVDELRRICDLARQRHIRLHLDGARLFVEAVHRGIQPAQQAALFDTVFVSLSKCFNAAAGAILAGPAARIDGLYHQRRMFGGSLAQAWPDAAVALHFADGFLDAYGAAWQEAERLFDILDEHPSFRVERIVDGTHIVRLHVSGGDLASLRERLVERDVLLPPVVAGQPWLALKVNPSVCRSSAGELAEAFRACV
jgi:threonine aldolase